MRNEINIKAPVGSWICIAGMTAIIIFADGHWKWMALWLLLALA